MASFFHKSASEASLLGDFDRMSESSIRWNNEKERSPQPVSRRGNVFRKAVCAVIAGVAVSLLLLGMKGDARIHLMREDATDAKSSSSPLKSTSNGGIRKGLISAGVKSNNFTWLEDVPEDWEVFKYVADDPFSELTVPRNQGREAMVYTTYIIDHYDDLPDYMVFVHGHEKGWHQPEPIPLILRALNLDALDNLDWVSLRCQNNPSCAPESTHLWPKIQGGGNPDWIGHLFTGLHSYVYREDDPWYEELPDEIAATCCAQFAVTKKAALSKPLEFWERLRAPMLRDTTDFETWGAGLDATTHWHLGVAYERGWHWFFGKHSVTCYEHDFCRNTIFSGKIHCDGITTDWPHSQWYNNITCTYGDAPPRVVSEELVFTSDVEGEGEVEIAVEGEADTVRDAKPSLHQDPVDNEPGHGPLVENLAEEMMDSPTDAVSKYVPEPDPEPTPALDKHAS